MNILSIDTSGKFCSISILLDDNTKDSINSKSPLSHSSDLAANVKIIINKYNIKITDLDCIAVNIGPGSFTGLRIGISFSKGLSLASNVPIIPVNAFDILESKIHISDKPFWSCIYSHKHYAYGVQYKNGHRSKPKLIDLNSNHEIPIFISGLDSNCVYDNDIVSINFSSKEVIDFGKKYFESGCKNDLNSIKPVYIDYINVT